MTLWAFLAFSGLFLVAVSFVPILLISQNLRKEREAEFRARDEVIDRKFRLRLLTAEERRQAEIDLRVELGNFSRNRQGQTHSALKYSRNSYSKK